MSNRTVGVAPTGASQYSDPLDVGEGHYICVSVYGTMSATMAVERQFAGDTAWRTWKSWTAAVEEDLLVTFEGKVRIGATAFTSGNPTGSIRRSAKRIVS